MPGVHYFPNGVAKIKYLTARELNTILRVCDGFVDLCSDIRLTDDQRSTTPQYLPPLLIGIRKKNNMDTIVIPTLRSLACVLLLGRFRVHTSDTLALLQQYIEKFGSCAQVCIKYVCC